jgi:MATE family multidrug resistance protein
MIFFISAFSQIFDGLRHILFGLLRGLLDTRFPMYSSLLIIWVIGVPLSYVLAFLLGLGVVGIVMGGTISMFIGALVLFYRWYDLSKKYQ